MRYFQIVLALAAAVSAIDIQGHLEPHCRAGGPSVTWQNVQPNQCQSNGGTMWAFSFNAIPTDWKIVTRSYSTGSCDANSLVNEFNSNGRDWICHGSDHQGAVYYHGAGYSFLGKKKRGDAASDVDHGQACSEVQRPDLLTLRDGQVYNIAGVEDGIVEEMVKEISQTENLLLYSANMCCSEENFIPLTTVFNFLEMVG